jgi:hypothetical protein
LGTPKLDTTTDFRLERKASDCGIAAQTGLAFEEIALARRPNSLAT